jgi:hypothetical protein
MYRTVSRSRKHGPLGKKTILYLIFGIPRGVISTILTHCDVKVEKYYIGEYTGTFPPSSNPTRSSMISDACFRPRTLYHWGFILQLSVHSVPVIGSKRRHETEALMKKKLVSFGRALRPCAVRACLLRLINTKYRALRAPSRARP